ncbi:hypothetical protein N9K75_01585 [bacterium]|nr:hypothetical protein [bacterium]
MDDYQKNEDNSFNDEYLEKISSRDKDIELALVPLLFSNEELDKLKTQLVNYIYINDSDFLICGSHLRWINLKNPEKIKLERGGIFCKFNMLNESCICKTYLHRHIQFNFDECLVFQKIDPQYQQLFNLVSLIN